MAPVAYRLIERRPESAGFREEQQRDDTMAQILIGGDQTKRQRLEAWLHAWGLSSAALGSRVHPAAVPATDASAARASPSRSL